MIALTAEHVAAIRAHASRTYPEECCGLLLGRVEGDAARVEQVRATANAHQGERGRRFLVDPRDHLAAQREARASGLTVLGSYHSHPDHPARPSEDDRREAWPNLHYVIVGVARGVPGEISSWTLAGEGGALRAERLSVIDG